MLRKIRASTDSLPTSLKAKGLILSRNNEVFFLTLNGDIGDIRNCEDIKVEIVELKCSGSKEDLICSALGYLCHPGNFTVCDI